MTDIRLNTVEEVKEAIIKHCNNHPWKKVGRGYIKAAPKKNLKEIILLRIIPSRYYLLIYRLGWSDGYTTGFHQEDQLRKEE